MKQRQWYEKFRWFLNSDGKIVIGGKSAEQNEEVIAKYLDKQDIVIHTASAGSPFAVIKASGRKIESSEIQEASIFAASFSRQWKEGKKKAEVHIFKPEQIVKEKQSKTGSFTVLGKVSMAEAELKLVLTQQEGRIRAVPISSLKNSDEKFFTLTPGKIKKEKAAGIILEKLEKLNIKAKKEDVLNALPSGSFSIS